MNLLRVLTAAALCLLAVLIAPGCSEKVSDENFEVNPSRHFRRGSSSPREVRSGLVCYSDEVKSGHGF